jgi:asparagine synthase (glutamine-hydrolysing)
MCGIAGMISLDSTSLPDLSNNIRIMNYLQCHRGPDGDGVWVHSAEHIALGHVRLSIIDLSTGSQPMKGRDGSWIVFNGEIYNYIELREEFGNNTFETSSDTEVILRAYERFGEDCLAKLRGMFAFAIWDEMNGTLFCARDRFGIKPFYFTVSENRLIFASEIKAMLPFVQEFSTDYNGLKDYFAFQFTLGEKTLFKGISLLPPAHFLILKNGIIRVRKYWEVNYRIDWYHTKQYFMESVRNRLIDSIRVHLRSDVPVGSYLSGGLDSSIVGSLARKIQCNGRYLSFHGKFTAGPEYDESPYARAVAEHCGMELFEKDFTSNDFIENIRQTIYHLDYPVAGPGAFPQYMVSKLAAQHLKVVLGGQGGDEIFGGYARYLVSYFEQCIKGAIDGTMHNGNYVVTYESIIPNLSSLRGYKPLLQEFWKEGLFDERDRRYFRLVNRANGLKDEINWELLEPYSAFETFRNIFWGKNIEKESYFDSMTHFDFKTLLPALLQVEDRMSMAHGLESRVPFLDHALVELVATIPSNIKFQNGELKHLLKIGFRDDLPEVINRRTDKMGFPVPLSQWMQGELKDFIADIFTSQKASQREYLNSKLDVKSLVESEGKFTRKVWGLLSLELWQQEFHDKAVQFRNLRKGTI